MASAIRRKARDTRLDLLDVSWSGFKRMLKVRGERRSPRIWYLDGRLTLVSPSMPHERSSRRLGMYAEPPVSTAFPFLASEEAFSWINQPHTVFESHWLLRLRAWVRDELVPRVRGEERRDGE